MIRRVLENARSVPGAEVVVVTDDQRIARAAREAGADAFLSRRPAASGSDRIRHYLDDEARTWPDLLVNLQADEPLLEARDVAALLELLRRDSRIAVATLLRALEPEEASVPDVVKAALLPEGLVEDFARLPAEDTAPVTAEADLTCPRRHRWLAHVGVYAFRAEAFRAFTDLPPSPRERRERLEQLRMIENGIAVHGATTAHRPIAVDTPADVERVRAVLRALLAKARP